MIETNDTVKESADKDKDPTYRDYITVAMEEYKTLRDESKQCSINMFTCFSFGFAAIGVFAVAGFAMWKENPFLSQAVFYVLVPIIIAFSTFIWLGEAARFDRVSKYICFIEIKLDLLIKPAAAHLINFREDYQEQIESALRLPRSGLNLGHPLIWEQWLKDLRARGGHLPWVYKGRLAFFAVIFGYWPISCDDIR